MTHPSIQGLREAVYVGRDGCTCGFGALCPNCGWERAAAYLTEHGVLLSGEGLVGAEPHSGRRCHKPMAGFYGAESSCAQLKGVPHEHYTVVTPEATVYRLVPVPQDGYVHYPSGPTRPPYGSVPQDGD